MLHRTNVSVRGLRVLLPGSTMKMWPCASVVSLCVCTERETQGARGLGVGPWGAHWPPMTCKLINMPLSVTAQLLLLPHCWLALFSHTLRRGLFSNSGWVTRSHAAQPLGQQSSLESRACLLERHHPGGTDIPENDCCVMPFTNSNNTISMIQHILICIVCKGDAASVVITQQGWSHI